MPEPALPTIDGTQNVVITGVGGTGVVTIGAMLAMAAHLDGKGAGMMEMAGLAQKGGAVHIHCRIAETPGRHQRDPRRHGRGGRRDRRRPRRHGRRQDAGPDDHAAAPAPSSTRTRSITGAFTRDPEFRIPVDKLRLSLEARLGERVRLLRRLGPGRGAAGRLDLFGNMILFGAAWQAGLIPLSGAAIRKAIELNGAAVEKNLRAFEIGRWAALHPDQVARVLAPQVVEKPKTLTQKIAFREQHLTDYQDSQARRALPRARRPLRGRRGCVSAVAQGYHKLLAYKDEYEVARLHLATRAKVARGVRGRPVAAPGTSRRRCCRPKAPTAARGSAPSGRGSSGASGCWPGLKRLRGTPLDPFGRTAERKMERALIAQYEADMAEVLDRLRPDTRDAAIALALLPLEIRGFGPVKAANAEKAAKRREELLAVLRAGPERAAAE